MGICVRELELVGEQGAGEEGNGREEKKPGSFMTK
jgi:hypothetical protein